MTNTEADLEDTFKSNMSILEDSVKFLSQAREANDDITTQVALVRISIRAMRISNFFLDFNDDADMLLRATDWPDIPENYKVPEHYHYPHK